MLDESLIGNAMSHPVARSIPVPFGGEATAANVRNKRYVSRWLQQVRDHIEHETDTSSCLSLMYNS